MTPVRVPNSGLVPEAVCDAKGILHLAYGIGNEAYYVQSNDAGKTFSAPVLLNRRSGTVTVGGERGPKLAVGKDGVIHVVWLGHYQRGGGVWYTRSTDSGRTFEPERNLLDTTTGTDGATVVADQDGNVFVLWLDGRLPPDPQSPVASPIYMTRSTDNGVTFSENEAVRHDHPGRACACCGLEARVGTDDNLYIAFRSGYHDIRDIYLIKGSKSKNDFTSSRVSEDNWKFTGCPMNASPLAVTDDGQALVTWMSRDRVYWAVSKGEVTKFAPRIPTPDGLDGERYPLILANGRKEVLLVWKQQDKVKWAVYTADGKLTDQQGTAGQQPSRSKPTAFVGSDDSFYIVF
ncbi:MAG: exo-alpha-sialidase [Armatimonadetes bacterium]|nr:exo-alpha-sialidase [Armatimonadota bacterium]